MKDQEDFVAERARDLVEHVVARGTVEAVHELGAAFSVSVVGDLVGLPADGREHLVQWALDGFDLWGPAGPRHDRGRAGLRALNDYCEHVAIPERLTPGGWGAQIYAAGEGDEVSPEECPGIIFGYLHAGMDTTASAIASMVLLFGQHPEAWQAVRADRSLLVGASNEALRLYSPVQRYTRFTTTDTEVDGLLIPADSRVAILIGSANRDDRQFPEPDTFDLTRSATEHIAFGFGVHHCAGAALAKTEMLKLFDALADRVETFELGDHQWGDNAALHGLAKLTVTLHPDV
jgi:cytochrome P450